MIDVYAKRMAAPINNGATTIHRMENAVLPITKISNRGFGNINRYYGLVHDHRTNAPHNNEWPAGEVWVHINKSKNRYLRLPVLKQGEVVEI